MEGDNIENKPKSRPSSIFDDPVDLFNFSQIQPVQSPSLSYAKMMQASRSVPGSRRNSSQDPSLDLLLSGKLSLNDTDAGFRRLPFAMTPQEPVGKFTQKQHRVLDEKEIPSFNPLLSQANESPIRSFANATPSSATMTNNSDDYAELFPMTHINNLPTAKPTENNGAWMSYNQQQPQPNEPIHYMQNQPMEPPRRYSYGWQGHDRFISPDVNKYYPPTDAQQRDMSQVMCPQFQQFGFCPRNDVCPFAHMVAPMNPATPFFTSMSGNSLYQQYNNQQQKPSPYLMSNPQKGNKKHDPQARRTQANHTTPETDKYVDADINDYIGQLYELCKDQNGCRFLQKKIEEKEQGEKNLGLIFDEIHAHFTELMTDPFGNYLCQKMLERCNNDQRTVIVETVAPELVKIALNMHGTRAVQKLIEYLATTQQIKTVASSLNANVVTLIKDLNGNHVIQKCLHRLSADNNQFIYDAVCDHCIEVASHKHGCCVLQRCFDHATISQKDQLVNEIARHALPLVQNPFGNYVVQYVLELGVTRYSESVIRRFVNHVCTLSVQKFSSNVIENCIRTAQPATRRLLIAELLNQTAMEKLLHDSFANYVVQTSLDFADEDQRIEMVECIRPLLPTIRTTPYGKRIHSKIFRDTKSNTKTPFLQQRQKNRSSDFDSSHVQQNHASYQ